MVKKTKHKFYIKQLITKHANPDKYKYSRYSIGFDSRSEFFLEAREEMSLLLEVIWVHLCILIIKIKIF